MAFNGSGTFVRLYDWTDDRDAAIPITASRFDSEDDGFATGLSTCITKDGQTTITANLPMAGFKHTGVGNANARDDYAVVGQMQDNSYSFAVGAGTANAQTVTLAPAITAYADGMVVSFEAGATNTGNTTLNVNSVGAQSVVLPNGDELPAGAITSGNFYTVIYDLTNTNWVLISGASVLSSRSFISANTTTNVISITADSLTTGSGISIVSNSSSSGTRNLGFIHNQNTSATAATALKLQQEADRKALFVDQNGDGPSIEIDSESTTAAVFLVNADPATTGNVFDVTADGLTTGSIFSFVSDSSSTGTRSLGFIHNDNTAATGTTVLSLQQDADRRAFFIDQNGNAPSISIASDATTAECVDIDASNTTSSALTITCDSLTSGRAATFSSTSTSTTSRQVVFIQQTSALATNAKCLRLEQGSDATALQVDQLANGIALSVNGGFESTANLVEITSNASDTSDRSLLFIHNDNASASSAECIQCDQDADETLLILNANHATFTDAAQSITCARAGSSSYRFLACLSNAGGDQEFNFRGDGEAFADGSFTGGGADYAEYIEWADGNPTNEDRRGVVVELVGDKIQEATNHAEAYGVISGNPSIVGDAAWNKWNKKYLRDDFGSYILEEYEVWQWTVKNDQGIEEGMVYEANNIPDDIKVPRNKEVIIQTRRKLNPEFDPDIEYIPRADRKEWGCVGLLGKLRIRKGQLAHPSWRKMKDISGQVEEWMIK